MLQTIKTKHSCSMMFPRVVFISLKQCLVRYHCTLASMLRKIECYYWKSSECATNPSALTHTDYQRNVKRKIEKRLLIMLLWKILALFIPLHSKRSYGLSRETREKTSGNAMCRNANFLLIQWKDLVDESILNYKISKKIKLRCVSPSGRSSWTLSACRTRTCRSSCTARPGSAISVHCKSIVYVCLS